MMQRVADDDASAGLWLHHQARAIGECEQHPDRHDHRGGAASGSDRTRSIKACGGQEIEKAPARDRQQPGEGAMQRHQRAGMFANEPGHDRNGGEVPRRRVITNPARRPSAM